MDGSFYWDDTTKISRDLMKDGLKEVLNEDHSREILFYRARTASEGYTRWS